MKATGVVRRIDELGRIVIPKEIRRTLKIKEGTPLEIYSDDNGELILKKYSPILEISSFAQEVAQSIYDSIEVNAIIANLDRVIAFNSKCKSFENKLIDKAIERLINARQCKILTSLELHTMFFADKVISNFGVCPIMQSGDVYGAIIIFKDNAIIDDADLKVAKALADFLGKQVG